MGRPTPAPVRPAPRDPMHGGLPDVVAYEWAEPLEPARPPLPPAGRSWPVLLQPELRRLLLLLRTSVGKDSGGFLFFEHGYHGLVFFGRKIDTDKDNLRNF